MSSVQLRQQGNALCKKKDISAAITLYWKAAEADRKDFLPLHNLTAAYYEIGVYSRCIEVVEKALALTKAVGGTSNVSKLKHRRIKAQILLGDFENASRFLHEDGDATGAERETLERAIRGGLELKQPWIGQAQRLSATALHKVVQELPRFKPTLCERPRSSELLVIDADLALRKNDTEYHGVGHDKQESLFRPSDAYQLRTSYLFAGIGDARHLHATLLAIAQKEDSAASFPRSQYHFTVVDLKGSAIARDILVFILLLELTKDSQASTEREEILATLFYLYGALIMPLKAYERLQWAIRLALADLNQSHSALPWLSILRKDHDAIKRSLLNWQAEVIKHFSTKRILAKHRSDVAQTPYAPLLMGLGWSGFATPKGCEKDKAMFDGAGILQPPQSLLTEKLQKTMSSQRSERDFASASFRQSVEADWRPNVTLVDLDWYHACTSNGSPSNQEEFFDIGFDPFQLYGNHLESSPQNPTCLYDYAASYFTQLAGALSQLQARIHIEVTVGEMCEMFEKIRHGLTHDRSSCQDVVGSQADTTIGKALRSSPLVYDRIHMSNIPDYFGGTLGCLLFAAPITKVSKGSAFFTSTCLRNSTIFRTREAFINEYCIVEDTNRLFKLFSCSVLRVSPSTVLPVADYIDWFRAKSKLGFADLLDRDTLTTWLYAIFLKMVLPAQRETRSWTLIYSPFNLGVFFRIILHLSQVGYPAQWLEEVLSSLLTNNVATRARTPHSVPLDISETEAMRQGPVCKMSVAPFVAELTTLASMWLPALGFGLFKGASAVPPATAVGKYSVIFDNVTMNAISSPSFVLLMHDALAGLVLWHSNVSPKAVISDDERDKQRRPPGAEQAHREGIHVISVWTFTSSERRATFWMRSDLMTMMQGDQKKWSICMLRVDSWELCASPRELGKVQRVGTWA